MTPESHDPPRARTALDALSPFSAGGFVVYYKRLERYRFTLPQVPVGADRIVVDAATLTMLLDRFDVRSIQRAPQWKPPKKSE